MKSLTKQLPHRKISTLLSSRNEMPNQYTRKVFHLISELFSVVEFLFWPRGWCYMLREWKIGRAGSDQTFVRRQHKSKDPPFDSPWCREQNDMRHDTFWAIVETREEGGGLAGGLEGDTNNNNKTVSKETKPQSKRSLVVPPNHFNSQSSLLKIRDLS